MSDFDAFLRIILENPDDDTARLMFADWLDEQGDPRGEFIRTQCALEELSEDDPRREQAETRQWILTQAHGRTWAGPIPRLVREFHFGRGFVEVVHMLASQFVEHAEELFTAAPIRHAVLYQSAEHIDALAACPYLERLRILDLKPEFSWRQTDYRAIQVDDDGLITLAESPHVANLRKLDLGYNVISSEGLSRLARTRQLANLKTLDLSHNEIGSDLVEFLNAPRFHGLEELYLGSNELGDDGVEAFLRARRPPQLRRLRLEANRIAPEGAMMLLVAGCLDGLEEIYLDGNSLWHGFWLFELNSWPKLKVLSLNSTALSDEDVQSILIDHRIGLGKLFLRQNRLRAACAEHLTEAVGSHSALSRLRVLDLAENNLGSEGAAILAGCKGLAGLKTLDLSANNIDNVGARALLESPYLQEIGELSLLNNPIDPDQAARLHQRFGHRLKIDGLEIP